MRPATDPDPEATSGKDGHDNLDVAAICDARARLRGAIAVTPVVQARVASAATGARVWIKHDHLQATGSFKERGAAHALTQLDACAKVRGVVAASAGNHALGLARHGARLGVPVTLVMPWGAAQVKVDRCRALGAEVRQHGSNFAEADAYARTLAMAERRRYVHPFDDVAVIAGQGTLALELIEQVPDLDVVVLPVGGGGLLAGVAVALRALRPQVRIVAVEPEGAASYAAAWQSGAVRHVAVTPTLADGLAVAEVGATAFALSRHRVDEVVSVSEDEIAAAMLHLFTHERTVAEGAGAVALAAVLSGRIGHIAGRTVALPVCGSNVDAQTFAGALQRALGAPVELASRATSALQGPAVFEANSRSQSFVLRA